MSNLRSPRKTLLWALKNQQQRRQIEYGKLKQKRWATEKSAKGEAFTYREGEQRISNSRSHGGGAHKFEEATGVSLLMFFLKGLNGCEESSHLFKFIAKGFVFFLYIRNKKNCIKYLYSGELGQYFDQPPENVLSSDYI